MYVVRAELVPSSLPFPAASLVANVDQGVGRGPLLASYYEVRDRVLHEAEAGHLEEALRLSDEALKIADQLGDQELLDQAYCNRSEFFMVLGHPVDFGRLREILMRNRNGSTSFSAAYQLAQSFRMVKKQHKKALFYARIARDRALAADNVMYLATSHNEIGNCLLAESYFKEAEAEYERALGLFIGDLSADHMMVYSNLGYTKIMLGLLKEGLQILFTSLRWCRRNPTKSAYESWIHLSLACAFIELGRWRYAWHHGKRGLELAEATGNFDAIKNGLYLMGEIEKSAGDLEAAFRYYSRMQKEFYPENSKIPELMLLVDAKQLVNLRA